MTLEIFLESDTKQKRVLVERWVFRHDARVPAGPGSDSDAQSLSVSAAYKQLVVFFRTLHAELRALPAHRYARRAAERSASGDARGGFAVAFEVSGESREGVETGEDSKPPPLERAEEKWSEPHPRPRSGGEEGGRASDTSTSLGMSGVSSSGILSSGLLHSSSSEGTGSIPSDDAPKRSRPSSREDASSDDYRAYAFAAAAAPGGGRLDASVYFLDADALAALDLGDERWCKACKPTLVDAYAHEARGGSGSGSDGYASSPGGFFVGDKKTTGARVRRAGSWKARATQFLATSPGSAKVGFGARPEPEDVDTPTPPSRVGIVLAGSGNAGTPPPGGSRGLGLLSAEMARFEPKNVFGSGHGSPSPSPSSGGIVHPSSFVGSPRGSPSGSDGPGFIPEKLHGSAFGSGPATPSSSSRPPLSPLAPSSAPVFVGGGPPPIFGFAESDPHGFRSGSPASASSGGGFLSALASRLASSPGMAIPGVGTLPFAFGSGSGSRGSAGGSFKKTASLASPSHALAARGSGSSVKTPDRRLTAHNTGSLSSAENADSPPWHFRGLLVPSGSGSGSGSPGATAPWRADRNPNVGGVSRRASWSSPSSSLSVSFQEVAGFANQKLPGGPFAYGTSPRCAALALGSSPESVAGTPGRAEARAETRLAAPSLVGIPGDADPLGPRRLASAFAADSADDALPFELDVEEEEDGRKATRESDEREEIDADAAVAALVRALREAPPLGPPLEPGSHGAPARAMTLAGAKRRLASMRREVVMARRHRGGKSSSGGGSSRASSEAERREATASVEGDEEKDEETAEPRAAASVAIDAAVDEALAFAAPL